MIGQERRARRGARRAPPTKLAWRRRASHEDRSREIFRSLGLVLRERGVASLTMQEIARRLGITKGNLYYYFRDKQDLLYKCHLARSEERRVGKEGRSRWA